MQRQFDLQWYLHMQISEIDNCRTVELDHLYDRVQVKKEEMEKSKTGEDDAGQQGVS